MVRFRQLFPGMMALAAAIITLVFSLINRITLLLFLKRMVISVSGFYFLGFLLVRYMLNEKPRKEENKGSIVDIVVNDDNDVTGEKNGAEQEEELEEFLPPEITNMDNVIKEEIRGGR